MGQFQSPAREKLWSPAVRPLDLVAMSQEERREEQENDGGHPVLSPLQSSSEIKIITPWTQSCPQIGIYPEFGSFLGAFLGRFQSCHCSVKHFSKNSGAFRELFLKKDKNSLQFSELLVPFGSMWRLFGCVFS